MIMKFLQFLILLLITLSVFGQSKIPNDTLLLGRKSTVVDKGIIFETNDGANNKKLLIEQSSKLLKFDGNEFRLGDASAGDKSFIFNNNDATNPELSVDFGATELRYNKDSMSIGDGTDTNKSFIFNKGGSNPFFRYDAGQGAIVFSNDGTTTKKVGSGGGGAGGQNFFGDKNPDAESGVLNWTNTGAGTFATNGTTPINGDNDFVWDASAQNDLIRTDQVEIPEKFKGQACEVNFTYIGGTDDLVKPQVVDSSNVKLPGATFQNQVDGTDFLQAQTSIVQRTIFLICPTSGTIAFEFNQTEVGNPAVMNFDDVFIGELIGLQTTVIDGDWTSFSVVVSAGFGTITSDEAFFRRDGTDLIVKGHFVAGTVAASTAVMDLPSGFTIDLTKIMSNDVGWLGFATQVFSGGINISSGNSTILFSDGSQNTKIFFNEGAVSTTAFQKQHLNAIMATSRGLSYRYRVPVVENAATPVKIFLSIPKVAENRNELTVRVRGSDGVVLSESVDAIDGDCTRDAVGRYTCPFVANLVTVLPGIECTARSAGDGSGNDGENCGYFALSTSGVSIAIDDSSAATDTDPVEFTLTITKQGVDDKSPTVQPILINQVETTVVNGMRTESCKIANSGTPIVSGTICSKWISSLTDNSTANTDINFIAGIFSEAPACTCVAITNTVMCAGNGNTSTTSGFFILTRDNTTGAATDSDIDITCKGKR